MRRSRFLPMALALSIAPLPAWAGPPFDTDDPEPTDFQHWELYFFGAGARNGGAFGGSAGLDLNYGGFHDVQLTATLPVDFVRGPGARTGVGDVELGLKYRFLHDDAHGWSVAAFPRAILPTSGTRYGSGRVAFLLPVWVQHDWGKWSLFGGGGFTINPGVGNRNYWLAAAALTRQVTGRLSIGVEATHRGPDTVDARPTSTLGIGAIWRLKGPLSLLASAGPSFGGRDGDKYHGYVALGLSF
ncbi:MAG: transporter [Sphingomonas sp.]|uniref:transporter n=1 Tax=Sphingomonas sp. TaxID=28214 RepID=UPI001ACC73CA|nr:transporter [Sphingomonas sp.]MBN8808628.1 transporter [Sphingomonas sp.]